MALAACESATSPDASRALDPNLALSDYAAMDKILATDALAGFRALGGRTGLRTSSVLGVGARVAGVRDGASSRDLTLQLARELSGGTALKEIISTRHRGMTLVYNAATDTYAVSPTRAGAPANGVRFITYEIDAAGKPILSKETGYADLLDEGATTGETIVLRLQVVNTGATVLDYRTRLTISGETGSISVDGFMSDGAARLDFNVAVTSRKSGLKTLLDADFDLQVKGREFSILGKVRGIDEATGDGTVALTVRHAASSVAVKMLGSNGTVDGTFEVNGKLLATATGNAKSPTITGPTGGQLTGGELLMLMHIVDMTDSVMDLVEDLVKPVDNLVVLGWLL
ncbi:MAG: hypothetical protein H7099_17195 [Gemmatimonadaceae bacterium]|nr:hypothetical protein [Gemmatimonadaceae bacterium]